MMTDSRSLIDNLFQFQELPRPPFIPLIGSFTAKLWQISLKNLLNDPTKLSNSIQKTYRLLKFDAVTTFFDMSLESEALGCKINFPNDYNSPKVISYPLQEDSLLRQLEKIKIEEKRRVPISIEVTRRLVTTLSKEAPIASIITGPLTLAKNIRGPEILEMLKDGSKEAIEILNFTGRIAVKMAKAYCDSKVDLIIITEDKLPDLSKEGYNTYKEGLTSVWNLARFYQIHPLIFFLSGEEPADLKSIFELGADGVAIGGINNFNSLKNLALKYKQCFAGCIPSRIFSEDFTESKEIINYKRRGDKIGFFLTSEEEIPSSTPPANLKKIISVIKSFD